MTQFPAICRMSTSLAVTVVATMRMSTSSGAGDGFGTCFSTSTSGGPYAVQTTACMYMSHVALRLIDRTGDFFFRDHLKVDFVERTTASHDSYLPPLFLPSVEQVSS